MADIRTPIEASANVAVFLNKNRTITFGGETLQLIYVSGTELTGDESHTVWRRTLISDGVRIVQTHSKKQYQISEHALLEQRKKHDINKKGQVES